MFSTIESSMQCEQGIDGHLKSHWHTKQEKAKLNNYEKVDNTNVQYKCRPKRGGGGHKLLSPSPTLSIVTACGLLHTHTQLLSPGKNETTGHRWEAPN